MEWIIKPCATPDQGSGGTCKSKCTGKATCGSDKCYGKVTCSQQCVIRVK